MANLATEAVTRDVGPLVGLFRMLSDRTRLSIIMILAKGERNVSSLCEELALPQPTVSHHLGLLRSENLISHRREGKQVIYGLNDQIEALADERLKIHAEPFAITIADHEGA